jgi:hypothetical protein
MTPNTGTPRFTTAPRTFEKFQTVDDAALGSV